MEGASKRITPSFFQKQNPADEAEAAIPSKRTPKETRLARSQTPAFREPRKRRADSPADGLSEFVERHRSARIDGESGTQRQLDSGGNRSNIRNAIFTLTQNSTPEATPNDSNAGDLSNNTSDDPSDDYSSSTTGSQINLRVHRRARNRDQREKQLRTEKSNRNQDDQDEELANTETEASTNPGMSPPNSSVTLPTVPDAIDKRIAELREVERLADLREVEKSTARREAARRTTEKSNMGVHFIFYNGQPRRNPTWVSRCTGFYFLYRTTNESTW